MGNTSSTNDAFDKAFNPERNGLKASVDKTNADVAASVAKTNADVAASVAKTTNDINQSNANIKQKIDQGIINEKFTVDSLPHILLSELLLEDADGLSTQKAFEIINETKTKN